jgi:hypothetical protein
VVPVRQDVAAADAPVPVNSSARSGDFPDPQRSDELQGWFQEWGRMLSDAMEN